MIHAARLLAGLAFAALATLSTWSSAVAQAVAQPSVADRDPAVLHVRLRPRLRWTGISQPPVGVAGSSDLSRWGEEIGLPMALVDSLSPLFPQPAPLLDSWHRQAARASAALGRPCPDHLGRWLRVETRAAGRVLEALSGTPAVVDAYRELEPVLFGGVVPPDDIPPVTPDFSALQAPIVGPAPLGLDFRALWPVAGGRGRGVTVLHLETGWFFGHEDLSKLHPGVQFGPGTAASRASKDHGSAVIGILMADRNGYGLDGVIDHAGLRVGSIAGWGGLPAAMAAAIATAQPGDVLALIIGFDLQQVKPRDLVPLEYFDAHFMAVQTATRLGIHVVEAAGNGANDLDDPRFAGRFDPAVRHSGAILVGSTAAGRLARQAESNHGRRISVSGWGDAVPATGFGQLFLPNGDNQQTYTDRYGGTSAATSLVVGAVAGLVGAIRQQDGREPTPAELAGLLERHGTSVLGGVGRRPDLRRVLGALGLPDGLALRDLEVDRGGSAVVTVQGPAAGQAFLMAALGPGRVPVPGAGRDLLLDPASMGTLVAVAIGADGSVDVGLPIPADAGLAGLELDLQAVTLGGGGGLRLTSSVNLRIR